MTSRKDLLDFINSKGYNPKGYNPKGYSTDIPDDNDLWDIIDENGWMKDTNNQKTTEDDNYTFMTNSRGMFHSTNGPARIFIEPSGDRIVKEYYINGILHRLDGPARFTPLYKEFHFKGYYISNNEQDYSIFLNNKKNWNHVMKPFYDDLKRSIEYGDLDAIKKYIDLEKNEDQLRWNTVNIFKKSTVLNHIHVVNYLFDILPEHELEFILQDIDIYKLLYTGQMNIDIASGFIVRSKDNNFIHKIFYEAVRYGQLEIVKLVIQKSSLTIDELLDYLEPSPIQLAAMEGHYNILEYIFKIAPRTANNVLALSYASEGGHLNVVKLINETILTEEQEKGVKLLI
jgi:hypothetical protein